ncbi:hypothetical protein FKO01_25440 [Mesorhizobium sp. B2-3-3]|nr:hypothetical protein FKO01_25440 [Mesorhizobium sp. B2-3-3]
MKVTNTQKGPRGLNTLDGAVLVDSGQAVDVELSDAELAVAKKTGWFEFGKGAKKEEGGDALSATEVLAMADGNFMAFKSAASKLLGDRLPSKKDEIVAALEELATQP